MAKLPDETVTTVLNLQRQLLARIDEAKATESAIFEQYGETETTMAPLSQLQNVVERLRNPYTRFGTLLLRIAEEQPMATPAMLNLLTQSITQAQATTDAAEATIQEVKRDWNLP